MSIITIPRVLIPLMLEGLNQLNPNFNADQSIASANQANGWAFRVPKTGTLDKVEFRSGTTASFPANGIRVSFQDLNASGVPDGVQDQYRDITSGYPNTSWIVPGLMTSDGTDTGTKRSVTEGDYLGIVIECANFVSGDAFQIGQLNGSPLADEGIMGQHAFLRRNTSAVWSVIGGKYGTFALKYSDGSYGLIGHPKWYPILSWGSASFNSGSSPDERGLRLIPGADVHVVGAWIRGALSQACDVVLYDSSDSVVASSTITTPYNFGQSNILPLAGGTLTAGAIYRLVLKPTSGSNVSLYHFNVSTNALLEATHGGIDWYYTQRTDAGAWTDTNTSRPWMGLIVDGVDDGAGGGGGSGGETSHVFIG